MLSACDVVCKDHDCRQAGRVITALRRQARVFVTRMKPASAHDLRRSFGQRLADAGVAIRDLRSIMRHRRFGTTEKHYLKQNAAEQGVRIAEKLGYATLNRTPPSETRNMTEVLGG